MTILFMGRPPSGGSSLFSSETFNRVGLDGFDGQDADDGQGDRQDQAFGLEKAPGSYVYPVGIVVEPAIDEPPADGHGDGACDGGEADEVSGDKPQDVTIG